MLYSGLEIKFHIFWCHLLFSFSLSLYHYRFLTQKPVGIMFIFRYSWSPIDIDILKTINFFWKGIPHEHFLQTLFSFWLFRYLYSGFLFISVVPEKNLKNVIWKRSQDQLSPVSLLFTVLATKVLGSKMSQLMMAGMLLFFPKTIHTLPQNCKV